MTPLVLDGDAKIGSALFLGAHCDDIEIGCGGTIQKLVAARPDLELTRLGGQVHCAVCCHCCSKANGLR